MKDFWYAGFLVLWVCGVESFWCKRNPGGGGGLVRWGLMVFAGGCGGVEDTGGFGGGGGAQKEFYGQILSLDS